QLEPGKGHGEPERGDDSRVEQLSPKLRGVPVDQSAHAIGARRLDPLITDHAVPSGAVLAVCKQADGNHAPKSMRAVYRDRAHDAADAQAVEENHAFYHEHAGDGAD